MELRRECAVRAFAIEINSTQHMLKGEGKQPVYAITPLGAKINRVYFVGVLLEKDEVKPDSGVWRLRIADPTGSIRAYVSHYQPEVLERVLDDLEPFKLVAVVGKLRVIEANGRKIPIIRPETINEVDKDVYNFWLFETLKATEERLENYKNDSENLAKKLYGQTDLNKYYQELQKVKDILREEYITNISEQEQIPEEDLEFEEEDLDISEFLD